MPLRQPSAETYEVREALTIEDRGFSGTGSLLIHDIGLQAIIDGAAGCGRELTREQAALVQQHIVSKGWQGAFRDTAYSANPVHVAFREFVYGSCCTPELMIEAAKRHLDGKGAEEHRRRIAVMEALIARRAAAMQKAAA